LPIASWICAARSTVGDADAAADVRACARPSLTRITLRSRSLAAAISTALTLTLATAIATALPLAAIAPAAAFSAASTSAALRESIRYRSKQH
jgi:hypothetical protein